MSESMLSILHALSHLILKTTWYLIDKIIIYNNHILITIYNQIYMGIIIYIYGKQNLTGLSNFFKVTWVINKFDLIPETSLPTICPKVLCFSCIYMFPFILHSSLATITWLLCPLIPCWKLLEERSYVFIIYHLLTLLTCLANAGGSTNALCIRIRNKCIIHID